MQYANQKPNNLASLALLLCLPAFSFNDEKEFQAYNGMTVKQIIVESKNLPVDKIQAQLLTGVNQKFSPSLIQTDIERIFSIGSFADVEVKITKDKAKQLTVKFILKDNPVVNKITIEGNSVYTDEEILDQLQTKLGETINSGALRQDMTYIEKTLYDEKGYILARIVNVDHPSKENNYTLSFYLEEGLIEDIGLEGNDMTKDYVILRELTLKKGSPFNKDMLIADLRNIFNLNYFASLDPRYEPSPKDPNKVILFLKVTEKSTGTINFGGGWGALQGGFAFTDVQFSNLFGTGQLVSAKAQFGDTSTYQLKYYNPWMWADRTSLTSRYWLTTGRPMGIEGLENAGTNERRYGGDLSVSKVLMNNIVGRLTFLNEDVAPSNNESYNIRSLGFSLAYDTRDVWMDPSSGVNFVVGVEEAGRFLNGSVSYTKWDVQLNNFFKIADQQTLASRFSWGRQSGEVKTTEEFWMGGPNTVRGFSAGGFFSRGREKALLNLEYRYRFNESIQGVLFFDIGNAWDTGVDFINSQKYRSSYGFGARINTPLGPIRLDYGVADDKELGRGVIAFSIGHVF
ncbi:MAG: BamA/TamA family outer membrane protein [Candidatus Margulisiibacteriota bacterium]|jgi:outer membrane protein insertion porin family